MGREGSKEFIEKPGLWPHWPILPVVNRGLRRSGMANAGLIHTADLTTIRLINLWDMSPERWHSAEQLHFDSVQALVDAGWEVD